MGFLMPPLPLTNFEIVYFDSLGVEHVPEKIKEFVENKNIKANISQVQANDSAVCE